MPVKAYGERSLANNVAPDQHLKGTAAGGGKLKDLRAREDETRSTEGIDAGSLTEATLTSVMSHGPGGAFRLMVLTLRLPWK